jgi:hypothetical protein
VHQGFLVFACVVLLEVNLAQEHNLVVFYQAFVLLLLAVPT